jgi:hypothetical protein
VLGFGCPWVFGRAKTHKKNHFFPRKSKNKKISEYKFLNSKNPQERVVDPCSTAEGLT